MRRHLASAVLLVTVVGLAVTTSAGKPAAKDPTEIPITVTFTDGYGYAIGSDGGGAYVHGTDGVRAVFVPLGNPVLDLRNTLPQRALSLDFGTCVLGACDPPDLTDARAFFMSTSYCERPFLDMAAGDSQECNLNVNFGAEGLGWFIRFGEYEGTTHATVERLANGSWEIDVPADGVAKLLSHPTKGRMVLTDRGDYIMPVHMTVALLP